MLQAGDARTAKKRRGGEESCGNEATLFSNNGSEQGSQDHILDSADNNFEPESFRSLIHCLPCLPASI
jgi:hypothetical protein